MKLPLCGETQQFVARRVAEQQGEELQGGRREDRRGDGEARAGQG